MDVACSLVCCLSFPCVLERFWRFHFVWKIITLQANTLEVEIRSQPYGKYLHDQGTIKYGFVS